MSEIAQGSGFYRRRIGDAVVTAINDGMILDLPLGAMQGIEPETASAMLQEVFRLPTPRPSVKAFLIQDNGSTILIDTGGRAMAELVIAQQEADFWLSEAVAATAPDEMKPYFAGAQTAVAPYRSRRRLLNGTDVAPGIQAYPLPGHTPGHTGYLVTSGDASLLIWGDVLHVSDVQARRPEVGMVFDTDPADAMRSRFHVLDMAAQDRLMVAGMTCTSRPFRMS